MVNSVSPPTTPVTALYEHPHCYHLGSTHHFLGTIFLAPHLVVYGWTIARTLYLILGLIVEGAATFGLVVWICSAQDISLIELVVNPAVYLPVAGLALWFALPLLFVPITSQGAIVLIIPMMAFFPALLLAGPIASVMSWPENYWQRFLLMPPLILLMLLPYYCIIPAALLILDWIKIDEMIGDKPRNNTETPSLTPKTKRHASRSRKRGKSLKGQ